MMPYRILSGVYGSQIVGDMLVFQCCLVDMIVLPGHALSMLTFIVIFSRDKSESADKVKGIAAYYLGVRVITCSDAILTK